MGFAISRQGRSARRSAGSQVASELASLLGEGAVVTTSAGRTLFRGVGGVVGEAAPAAVVLPGDEQTLVKAVRFCHQNGLDVVPRGGATSVRGGAIGGSESVVIATTRLNRIGEVHRRDRMVEAEAGAMLMAIDRAAAGKGLRLGVGPRVGSPATLGGGIAKDICGPAGGAGAGMAARVDVLRLILADGEAVELRGGAPPLGGYDLAGVVAGSEGTLGIISKATLRLEPRPEARRLIAARFKDVDAAVAAAIVLGEYAAPIAALDVVSSGFVAGTPVFAEIAAGDADDAAGALVLAELEGYAEEVRLAGDALRQGLSEHGALACEDIADEERCQLAWEAFDGAPARLARGRVAGISDVVVSPAALQDSVRGLDEIAKRHGLEVVTCIRAGAGAIQSLFRAPGDAAEGAVQVHAAINEAVALAAEGGGLATGSFGAGVLKTASAGYAGLSAADIGMQLAVKAAFDGEGIFNRGKVVA